MTKTFKDKIIEQVTFVSGVAGFANSDLTKANTKLSKDKYDQGVLILETNKGKKVSISIIVDADVRAKVIAYEITSSIKALAKKNKEKLDNVNIYIRGVK